jgi:ATP-dependent DNA helicase RecQ
MSIPITSQEDLERVADDQLSTVLKLMAGPRAVAHADQRTAVRALVAERSRVLVVQATGWGKSAVYWAATAALRALGGGTTLVVSPLLALMRDQVAAAERAGLRAVTINSANVEEWDRVMAEIEAGSIDVLLVSPERLANPMFARRIGPIVENAGLIVIDEAHCISDWGFDFRPDYQRLSRVLVAAPNTPVLATTATANTRVTADVARQLGEDTVVLRGGLARTSLRLSVVPGLGALERYAWVDQALEALDGSGIVYVPTVADTVRLAQFLLSRGHTVAAYSGQLEADVREAVEDNLRHNRLKAVVATSALGMGYDKPDLGFCIHVGSPDSPVAYYQQVGRAGRAIDHADAILLPSETDERLWEYFMSASIPDPEQARRVVAELNSTGPLSVARLSDVTTFRRGRLESLLKILSVDGVVERTTEGWVATGVAYEYEDAKWTSVKEARRAEADLMRRYASGEGCLMEFLQRALDDPDPGACGTCSVCTGILPHPGRNLDPERVEAARVHLRGVDVVIEPRKLWPTGLEGRRGRIVGAALGRALAFADAPGWPDIGRLLSGTDGPLPEEVVRGIVAVLSRWKSDWSSRPVAVVPVPSRSHEALINDLSQHVAAAGHLPLVHLLEVEGPRPADDTTSAARVSELVATLRLRPGVSMPDGPVLLIDDTYRTGWTITVAAALLREAGVPAVLPLVVHERP